MIEHTYIELLGLKLADPLTFVSDVFMAIVSFYCGHRLFHDYKTKYAHYAAVFFLFLGISSLMGGTAHLFDLYFGKMPHLLAWGTQGISVLFIELACLTLIPKGKFKYFIRAMVYAFFGAFVMQLVSVQHFDVVKFNSSIGLIGFLVVIHVLKYFETRDQTYLKAPLSIGLFIIPALIHSLGIGFNKWIDHNVISHMILLPCYYYLYDGIRNVAKLPKKQVQQVPQPTHLTGK